MKKIKRIVTFALLFSMAVPVFAAENATSTLSVISGSGTDLQTSLEKSTGIGANPIVKAKWEMNTDTDVNSKYLGTDDSSSAGAQFLPSGQYQIGKDVAICAVVTDPDGLADINAVYADIFYPENIDLGPNHDSTAGCGSLIQEIKLNKLAKADGLDLLCNKIRNNNNNLPTWNTDFDYDEVCAQDGELQKETAAVFCGEQTLSYEDPSGSYRVLALAQDKYGLNGTLENNFSYLELTAFETDFNSVSYGDVKLNTHKIINGDLTWGNNIPSVRNVGNTRLNIKILQDDMGLGMTDGQWNVKWDARVGSDAVAKWYWPEVWTTVPSTLNLSETDEMDFSIYIYKFPPVNGDSFVGTMTLSASKAAHLTCESNT